MAWSLGKILPMQRDDALRLLRERREQLHAIGVGQLFLSSQSGKSPDPS